MIPYATEHCVVDHQIGPDQDYWYLAEPRTGYDAAAWPTREAMLADLREIIEALDPEAAQ